MDHVGKPSRILRRDRERQRVRGKDVTMEAEVRVMVTSPGN